MNSEPVMSSAQEDALLAGVYVQMEETFLPNRSAGYDVEVGLEQFMSWLEGDTEASADMDDEVVASAQPMNYFITGAGTVHITTPSPAAASSALSSWQADITVELLRQESDARKRRARMGQVVLGSVMAFAGVSSILLAFAPSLGALVTVAIGVANLLVAVTGLRVHAISARGWSNEALHVLLGRDYAAPGQQPHGRPEPKGEVAQAGMPVRQAGGWPPTARALIVMMVIAAAAGTAWFLHTPEVLTFLLLPVVLVVLKNLVARDEGTRRHSLVLLQILLGQDVNLGLGDSRGDRELTGLRRSPRRRSRN